ncbi:MAG: DNA mismatch repair endonuclease MutL, partial [Phycisphaeraceae bacterium]
RLTSRPRLAPPAADAGACIEVAGEDVVPTRPAPASPGTVVEVRDLFFNTPARRKFLRAASTEFGHISEMFQRIAMVHERVALTLTHNGRTVFELNPAEDRMARCVALLGDELRDGLLEFDHEPPPPATATMRVRGLAGVPSLARATGRRQYVCVNGRPVRDRQLSHAIKEAYRGLIAPDRHPLAVVFLEMDAAAVDVNVHPAKAEVRFREPGRVHGLVLTAIRQRLLGADLTPTARVPDAARAPWSAPLAGGEANSESQGRMFDEATRDAGDGGVGGGAGVAGMAGGGPHSGPYGEPPRDRAGEADGSGAWQGSTDAFVDYFRRMDPKQKGFVYQQVRQALEQDDPRLVAGATGDAGGDAGGGSGGGDGGGGVRRERILQIHESYVVTEDEHGLLIVDQHALHERVMFEQLRRRVLAEGRNLESQRLLMPTVLSAGDARQALLEGLTPLLTRIGVELGVIGPRAVAVQAFPSFLFDRGVEPEPFLEELLDKVEAGEIDPADATAEEAALHEVLDMMACKAAVKAGQAMTEQELSALLAKRQEVERSSNCPHGRPTAIRLTLRDLEKQFGRRG